MSGATSSNASEIDDKNYILNLLSQKLPRAVAEAELPDALQWCFPLATRPPKKPPRVPKKKKAFLTRDERKKYDILKLPKSDWNHAELEPMRQLWKEYMRKNLSLYKKTPKTEDPSWNTFNVTLCKSEFVGAELTVVRSKIVNQIGMSGTVVLETKSTFQIVTSNNELKSESVLVKKPSVFSFVLDKMKFTVFGKHIGIRPNERSVKKLKTHFLPDL
ncbi:hypothetical protein FQR65_LT04978 [Abscondita terminalis]|nr:hypothetical protein FQR65_LT04978 [Abscondita terminalis]